MRFFAQIEQYAAQLLLTNEALCVRVQIGVPRRELNCFDTDRAEMRSERLRKQRVAVVNNVSASIQKSSIDVRKIASDLLHPSAIRLLNNTGHFNSARLKINDEEYEIAD